MVEIEQSFAYVLFFFLGRFDVFSEGVFEAVGVGEDFSIAKHIFGILITFLLVGCSKYGLILAKRQLQ